MQHDSVDLLVIGGGINGAGIACDAAGRGLSVILCDKDDLANHTSSASSKLIHGGLRYLEQYEFKLVRESLKEREILMRKAPYLIRPLNFVLPHDRHLRPAWMIRCGLFLYDHLSRRQLLPPSKKINLGRDLEGNPLKDNFKIGFRYADCQTADARLTVLNALSAHNHHAKIMTRTKCVEALRQNDHWLVTLQQQNGEKIKVQAKAIVNATGAWVSKVLQNVTNITTSSAVKLIKGSHFTVPKFYEGDHAYILQNPDGRIVFVIPYKSDFALIGTTDVNYTGDPNKIEISQEEIDYLLKTLKYYFKNPPLEDDINWTYAGVRALYDDHSDNPSNITRDFHLDINDEDHKLPIVSVFGGKVTTYRVLAEMVMAKLKPYFPDLGESWTAGAPLPGGKIEDFSQFRQEVAHQYAWMPESMRERLINNYGTRIDEIMAGAKSLDDLGQLIGRNFYEKELDYLIKHEWAQTVDDIIWRRTKIGLYLTDSEISTLSQLLDSKRAR